MNFKLLASSLLTNLVISQGYNQGQPPRNENPILSKAIKGYGALLDEVHRQLFEQAQKYATNTQAADQYHINLSYATSPYDKSYWARNYNATLIAEANDKFTRAIQVKDYIQTLADMKAKTFLTKASKPDRYNRNRISSRNRNKILEFYQTTMETIRAGELGIAYEFITYMNQQY